MSWLPRRRRPVGDPADHEVTVVTRVDCHLCDDAVREVEALAGELGFAVVLRDVDTDPELLARYADRVPVVLVDGREHGWWRVEPDRLRAAVGG